MRRNLKEKVFSFNEFQWALIRKQVSQLMRPYSAHCQVHISCMSLYAFVNNVFIHSDITSFFWFPKMLLRFDYGANFEKLFLFASTRFQCVGSSRILPLQRIIDDRLSS